MALVTTVGSPLADSYVTVAEADAYLASREPFSVLEWEGLAEEQKEYRLRWGAILMDRLRFRGIKACKTQARAFPRIFPGEALWPRDYTGSLTDRLEYRYEDWEDIVDAASLFSTEVPGVPDAVKKAQIETAFQLVHNQLFTQNQTDGTDQILTYFQIGSIAGNLKSASEVGGNPLDLIPNTLLSQGSVIKFLLQPYLASIRGVIV